MFVITKQFDFESSHQLTHLGDSHKCGRNHGHSYRVVVVLAADNLNDDGFVVDFGELAPLKGYIDALVDHRFLNDVFGGDPKATTSENLAKHFYGKCVSYKWPVVAVAVSETERTWAWYSPSKMFALLV